MVMVDDWESTDKLPNSFDRRGDVDDAWVLRDEAVVTIALCRQAKGALFTSPKIWKKKGNLLCSLNGYAVSIYENSVFGYPTNTFFLLIVYRQSPTFFMSWQ